MFYFSGKEIIRGVIAPPSPHGSSYTYAAVTPSACDHESGRYCTVMPANMFLVKKYTSKSMTWSPPTSNGSPVIQS